uniref:Uncharacterized protein n=1 Tax=Arundo donax TaxID=35708 RepID=A0A0A8Y1G2_ARUDO
MRYPTCMPSQGMWRMPLVW